MTRSLPAFLIAAAICSAQDGPQPRVVDPGKPGQPPSDAIVLFSGKDLSEWTHEDGSPVKWTIANGEMICKSGAGDVLSKHKFSSAQIHVEFFVPFMPKFKSQMRGNSGVFLQGRYEVQVLDSYQNPTYANGSCGALYSQYAPLVNACRPPEQWQSYEIVFHAPKCGADGKVSEPGTLTLLHNGVLVQDHVTVKGTTDGSPNPHVCEPGPLKLQDHDTEVITPVRFRNIWYRPLD
jgi:hypothetical protein